MYTSTISSCMGGFIWLGDEDDDDDDNNFKRQTNKMRLHRENQIGMLKRMNRLDERPSHDDGMMIAMKKTKRSQWWEICCDKDNFIFIY